MSGTLTLAPGQVFTGGSTVGTLDTGQVAFTQTGTVTFNTSVTPNTLAEVVIIKDVLGSSQTFNGGMLDSVTITSVTPNSTVTLTTADLPPGITVPPGFTLPQTDTGTVIGVTANTNFGPLTGTAGIIAVDGPLVLVGDIQIMAFGQTLNAGAAVLSLGTQMTGDGLDEVFTPVGGATRVIANLPLGTTTIDGSSGSTTINLDTVTGSDAGFASTIIVDNSGAGLNTVNIATSSIASGTSSVNVLTDVIGLSGNSSVAATVNAGGSAASGAASTGTQQAEVFGFLSGAANGVFNGGAANVILFGVGAQGSATLFGGFGTDIDAGSGGLIEAGSGGHSLLFGSFTQATTLVGGSSTDILAAISLGQKNTTMIAGSGAETLASFNQGAVFQGVGVSTLMGQGSIAPSTTNMIGEIGGNSFQIGAGATQVQANNLGTNTYQEGLSAANGVATITGFDLGSDTVSLTNPAGGKYALGGTGPTGLTFTTGGSDTAVHFGDGTTWTVVGATLTNNNFG